MMGSKIHVKVGREGMGPGCGDIWRCGLSACRHCGGEARGRPLRDD